MKIEGLRIYFILFVALICFLIQVVPVLSIDSLRSLQKSQISNQLHRLSTFIALPAIVAGCSNPALANEGIDYKTKAVSESISRIAARIPGYGPSDIVYPKYFEGTWRVSQTFSNVISNSKQFATFDWPYLQRVNQLILKNENLSYLSYFVQSSNGVVSERGSTKSSLYESIYPGSTWMSRFDLSTPNNLFMTRGDGYVEDVRVTKRSIEDLPSPLTFGYSEFSRIAATISSGLQANVPQIFATRILARFRAKEREAMSTSGIVAMEGVDTIEAVERLYIYVTDQSSFQPIPESNPTFTIKSTSIMRRVI